LKDLARLGGGTALMEREWPPCRYHPRVRSDISGYAVVIARGLRHVSFLKVRTLGCDVVAVSFLRRDGSDTERADRAR